MLPSRRGPVPGRVRPGLLIVRRRPAGKQVIDGPNQVGPGERVPKGRVGPFGRRMRHPERQRRGRLRASEFCPEGLPRRAAGPVSDNEEPRGAAAEVPRALRPGRRHGDAAALPQARLQEQAMILAPIHDEHQGLSPRFRRWS